MKKIYFSTLILAMALSACQEDDLQPLSPSYDGEMRFSLVAPGAQTKANSHAFEASDKIGVYVTDWIDEDTPMSLQVSGNRANNLSMTFNGSSWTPAKTLYWGEGKSDVYAYYPYMDKITDVNSQAFSVASDQSVKATKGALSGYEASDLLWARALGVSQENGAVTLAMKHIMSKLTVKIVAGEDYVGSLPEDASVLLHSTVIAACVDLETGAVVKDPYSGTQSIKMNNLGIKSFSGVDAVVYEAVVVPQMLETTVPLLEINSKSVSYLLEDSFNFRPGVAYTYTVTLNTSTTAIKVEIGCELEDWNSTSGGNQEGGSEEGGSEEEGDDTGYTNLSVKGTANSYIVSAAGDYKFKAVQGNLDATVGNVKTVEVLWETFGTDVAPQPGDLIAEASYRNGNICFSTSDEFKEGNALIAAKNSAGTILWSWHIWLTDEPQVDIYRGKSGMLMDRNLGATSAEAGDVGSLGLLYQWGRKDPFLGSSSVMEPQEAASTGAWKVADGATEADKMMSYQDLTESNPTTFYTSGGGGQWKSKKTASDPCPVGWRVPDGDEGGFWEKADFVRMPFEASLPGMHFNIAYPDLAWFPAAGYRDESGVLKNTGSVGFYSSLSTYSRSYALLMSYDNLVVSGNWWYDNLNWSSSAPAYSVRCYKDFDESYLPETMVPDFSTSDAVDLSVKGTANSYIVSSAGTYSFPAVKGNSKESIGTPVTASVVWETFGTEEKPVKKDLLEGVKVENGKIYFKTAESFREGNALVSVEDADGKILWSWHIWLTDEPQEQVYYNDAGTMMDRNLGATSAIPGDPDVLGLNYQWGRKDPFMGQTMTNQYVNGQSTYHWPVDKYMDSEKQSYAVSHPTVFIYNWGDPVNGRYENTLWQSQKTVNDPCPPGWRIPDGGPDGVWAKASGHDSNFHYSEDNGGYYSGLFGDDEVIYYPAPNYDQWSYMWSCTPSPNNAMYCYGFHYSGWGDTYPCYELYRTDRRYVRCQKE